jgi:PAS domain S-box-containing protein
MPTNELPLEDVGKLAGDATSGHDAHGTSHLPFLLAHFDRELRYKSVNRAYAERVGVEPAGLVGRTALEVLGPEVVRVITPFVERVLAGERVEYEAWVSFKQLGRRYMRSVYTPELDAAGTVVGYLAAMTDETVRRDAEEALVQSRARLDFVAESAEIGVWSCDLPFAELIWNAACKAHFGLPADATVRIEDFYDQMHADDVAQTRRAIDDSIESGRPYDVEYRTRQQDGSYKWIRAVGRTDYDDAGRPRRFEGITVDVSTAKNAEERFRELADAMPQIVWSVDAQGTVDYLNRRWYELTGKTQADRVTTDVLHPDDRAAAQAAFARSLQSGEPYEQEHRLCLPAFDEPRWFLARALPVRDDAGRITRWYATSTDIHEHKLAEAALLDSRDRLRAALDASTTGTFRWDIESNALDWDENLDRLFGLAPGATARSLPEFVRMVHPDDRQRVIAACARCATDNVDFVEEFRVVWPDGTVRWLFDQGRVFVTKGGGRYMTGACVDITDRRNKEDALRAADRQKDEFLGMLAHEIRNPLAPILYSASALERRIDDPESRKLLDVISRQGRRMVRIVDDLLDVSRVTQGKIGLQRERISVAALLSQCVDATRSRFEARGHVVRLHAVDPSLAVVGDTVRLSQVLENLLINAAKYTPDGGQIDVSARAEAANVAILVKDTGIGIAPDMLRRVFELFAQADTSLDRAEGGLGIGLTLAERLTNMHGGTLEAQSAGPGQGSTFVIRLPHAAAPIEDEAPSPASTRPFRPLRVLIVDDNRDSAEMLQTLMEMSGHTAHLAHDGVSAVPAALDTRPDVILMDIGLPGKDGYQVVKELRALPETAAARIVATTGYGRDEDRSRCLAAGFDAHLTKPISASALAEVLSRV